MMRQSFLMCYKSIALAFMMLIALCLTFQSKANVRKADVYVPMAEITDRSLCDFLKSDIVPIASRNYSNAIPQICFFIKPESMMLYSTSSLQRLEIHGLSQGQPSNISGQSRRKKELSDI